MSVTIRSTSVLVLLVTLEVSRLDATDRLNERIVKWAFVARFCFLSDDGQFEYHIEYDKLFGVQNLLLYFDEQHQWPSVYKTNKTCKQKEAVLSRDMGQIVSLNHQQVLNSGCYEIANRTVITCHNSRRFRSARERWWFLAISNCNSTQGLYMRYKFVMTNGAPEDFWHQQFSADEFFILPVLIGYFATYLLLLLAVFMCTAELKARQLLHATYKIFNASVTVQQFGIILQGIAYIRYANNGIGYPRLRNLGRLLESASEVLYLLLMLLLAKGYTVTRGRLRVGSSVKLTVFMFMYIATYTSLFLYEAQSFDPGEVLYIYESPAGYGLILLRIIAWWMFIYSTVFTLKHYPEKANFYYPFNLIGTLWFVAGPAFILTANSLIDKWVRESVVCAVQHFIALVGHILFLILTLPNKANKNFPYHVRTTQIGVMELTDGRTGNNTLDHFGHHPYAPGGPPFPGPPFHYAASTRSSTPLNMGPVYRVASSHPLREWMVEVPVELFTVSRAVAIERLDMQRMQEVDLPGSSKGSPPSSSGVSSRPNTEMQHYQETSHATSTEAEQQSLHQQPVSFPLPQPITTAATIYSLT